MGIGAKSEVVRTQTGLSPQENITTTDRAKAVPLSSPLFNVCLTCTFNELMDDWRYVCVCMCMSVLCLRGGCIFCVTFPALVFSYLFMQTW